LHVAFVVVEFIKRKPRIIPYFNLHLNAKGETSAAFRAGFRVALNLEFLDQLCAEIGTVPLSRFGFSDDAYGQEVVWHLPAEALLTVSGLIERLASLDGQTPADPYLISDLEKLAAALRKAIEAGASFCLVLRDGADDYISPTEMDRRQGFFW
jgi:hypothetical protein